MSLFVEHEKRKRWSSAQGWVLVRTWRGPRDEVDAFVADDLPDNYSELEIAQELDGWNTVTATYSIANYVGDPSTETGLVSRTWTLESAVQNVPLIGHPKAVHLDALTLALGTPERWVYLIQLSVQFYRYQMERFKRSEIDTAPTFLHPYWDGTVIPGSTPANTVTGAVTADYQFAKTLAEALIKDDNAGYLEFSYVLRKTEVVSTFTALVASHTNVGRFFSYAGISAAEPTMPGAALIGAGSLPTLHWLKQPPQVQQVSGGQFQIQQDYMGAAAFDAAIYGSEITS